MERVPSGESREPGAVGKVVLAATPLGNVGDASPRLVELLRTADIVAAEDTRRLRRLAASLDIQITGRVVSYFEGNERDRARELIDEALGGACIAVVTDAGMPSVSDPGYRIVAEAAARGVWVTALPGPSAVLTALALSGLAVDRFCFEGFLPRKAGERSSRIASLAAEPRTMVFFEAPHRLHAMLVALAAGLGDGRQAAVCRELTKTYEEVKRGTLGELARWADSEIRGEITVVVAGASADEQRQVSGLVDAPAWVAAVRAREAEGMDRRSAIAEVAKLAGVQRRSVYDSVVQAKAPRP
ncbi:MAG: 16S rRNA (cytidine(1402)-2'-O)-methyltransferase [Actinobacteria bacterium]|nr:16S rRNA (cytidine(1402)-2'-O)-methyltransferase [Actinomycetota bacterium]